MAPLSNGKMHATGPSFVCVQHTPQSYTPRCDFDSAGAGASFEAADFTRRGMMVRARRTLAFLFALAAGVPGTAFAQAIAGTVHDASGAALPAVTVEAASAALMERIRTVVSDGNGQYRIEGLRPGVYTVTFTR